MSTLKKSHIVAGALVLYLLIAVIGSAAYFAYEQQQAKLAQTRQAETQAAAVKEPPSFPKEEPQVTEAELKARDAQKAVQEKSQELKGGMQAETINGVTYYKHHWPKKPAPGVYLRPFVAEGQGVCLLKNDVYYYYNIHDPEQTAWIMGDHVAIIAGGQTTTIAFDPSTMRKHMASDAEWLVESYVVNADKKTVAAFKRIAQSKQGELVYYKEGGKARRHTLSAEEVTRISEMVELYELLSEMDE